MSDCKYFQSLIDSFDAGNLPLKSQEQFIHHLEHCKDCREEFEIYYLIEYGLNDTPINAVNSKYKPYMDVLDFKGLVEHKLNDTKQDLINMKHMNNFLRLCLFLVEMLMILTVVIIIIILFF